MIRNRNIKRAITASYILSLVHVLPVSAHHNEHYPSEISHLWAHILIGVVFLLIAAGIYYTVSNWKKRKNKRQTF